MIAVGLLGWRDSRHFDDSGDKPCTQCRTTTPVRSHAGEPVHKVCAEDWNDRNPDAPRVRAISDKGTAYELGTERYHSDPPKKRRKDS
ncbi:hypothetical protein [Streptomyces mirabilis]|uniref:hypothetical protein n=1 Tax=Streptomyces mirabilis TaxID=68239 RepID=UPI0036DC644A